jgi:hypothetical protein
MSGSNLKFIQKNDNLIEGEHSKLQGRNKPYQHPLDSVFRQTDGKSLKDILSQLESYGKDLVYELITNIQNGQTVVKLTKFTYNPLVDKLLVNLCGLEVYEGVENQYILSGVDEITFTFPLKANYQILVVLGGTVTSESFGDTVENGLTQFKQLADVPKSYFGSGNKVVKVNEQENGLIFSNVKASNDLVQITSSLEVSGVYQGWLGFVESGLIKGIRVSVEKEYPEDVIFDLSIWDNINGEWIYYSGQITNILWDIMDIPHIDNSGLNRVYIQLNNHSAEAKFNLRVFIVR